MNSNLKNEMIERRIVFASRVTGLVPIFFFGVATILILVKLPVKLVGVFVLFGGLIACIGVSVPGFLVIFGLPKYAYIWNQARRIFYYSGSSWEFLSNKQKRKTVIDSVIGLLFVIAFVLWAIMEQ